jgi:glycosyltransferase involved in cell wall biosynthesis
MKFLNETDAVVFPSRDDTMPIAMLEAMGLSKTVISTEVGGVREWLHHEMNGLLVPREDAGVLAREITRCVETPALMRQLGDAASRTFEEQFGMDRFGEDFIGLVHEMIAAPAKI